MSRPGDRLGMPAALLDRLERHAIARRPEECCGVLIGHRVAGVARVRRLIETDNVWPGDRRRRYSIDPERLLEAHVEARREGLEVVGYYHSHPASGAEPSAFDRSRAWPGPSYLIAAVDEHGLGQVRSWRLEQEGGRFVEEPVETHG